tara:strand:+ start:17169 stop:17606 length:438 start_codon:yes stop_codon:yes gene_type:complete
MVAGLTMTLSKINNSKFFAGFVMILLNIGSRFVKIEVSKSQEKYLKKSLGRHLMIFGVTWLGTRDLLIALSITAIFNVLIDYLLNEKSRFCIIPHKHREFEEIMDLNNNGEVSENEINKAIEILNKAKKTAKNKDIIKNMGYFSL